MAETFCPRVGKWFGGCRFEGRYDTPITSQFDEMFGSSRVEVRAVPGDPTKTEIVQTPPPVKKYVRDVCTTCGRTIERLSAA